MLKIGDDLVKSIKKYPIVFIFITALLLAVGCYGSYEAISGMRDKTYMEKTYLEITGWRISHIILHMTIGFFLPEYFSLSLVIGVVWEAVEFTLAKTTDRWWGTPRDNVQDLFTNNAGFAIGYALNRAFVK